MVILYTVGCYGDPYAMYSVLLINKDGVAVMVIIGR